jgi:hypothetical protein
MKNAATLLLVCTLFLVPRAARADDPFAAYRIPTHSWWTGTLRASADASQLVRQNSSTMDNRSLLANGNTSVGWGRDSEPLAAWFEVAAQAQSNRQSRREWTADAETQEHDSNTWESWSTELGGRFYPGPGPLGWELDAFLYGSYLQYLAREDMRQDIFDDAYHIRSREMTRQDGYTTRLQLSAGPLLGRVRDATPVHDVHVLEGRLLEAGALHGPLSDRARERLAAVLAAGAELGAVHDRPARFVYREVERVLREEGAIGEGGLGAYAALRIAETTRPRARFQRLRGSLIGPLFMATTGPTHVRWMNERDTRLWYGDSLLDQVSEHLSSSSRSIHDEYWAGGRAEFHRPLGWRWQLDADGQAALATRIGEHGAMTSANVSLAWDVADRWAAGITAHQQRTDLRKTLAPPVWLTQVSASVAYDLEDRLSLSLSLSELQYRYLPGGDYQRSRQLSLGLDYRFLGAFDAPGVMGRMQPRH